MSLFRRRKEPEEDPVTQQLAQSRAGTVAAGEPAISDLLQELDAPFQRKGDAWLVEVGGAWATFGWIPRDATLAGFLAYEEAPGAAAELVRANAETGLAWYQSDGEDLLTRVSVPAEALDRTGLALALGALRREAGGTAETPLRDAPEPRLEAALQQLGVDPEEVVVAARGDIAELRIKLAPDAAPDEAAAGWMLQMSAIRGARLGIDGAGALTAIAAVPGRPVTAGALAWALGEGRELARLYRAA